MSELWPWLTLAGLGVFHGLNPAMGWLFAVALGLQERRLGAVLEAMPPIALGHALSVLLVALGVAALGAALPQAALRYAGGLLLIGFGIYKLLRRRHPRWVGMRVGFKELTMWSLLMASAHGAGLMLVPVLLELNAPKPVHAHLSAASASGIPAQDLLALGLHTLAMFAAMALAAVLVYRVLGLG